MGAYDGVSKFFDNSVAEIAKSLEYSEDNIIILQGNLELLKEKYPETYNNLMSCKHHADRRTAIDYAKDLVASWLFEDYFMKHYVSSKYTITLSGADKNRKILPNTRTSASSDFLISYNDTEIKMELMNDYTGFWKKSGKLHLRDAKYKQLKDSRSLFLGISTIHKEFILYDFRKDIPSKYIPSHFPYGGKPAQELAVNQTNLIELTEDNLEKAILQCLEQT